MLCASDTSVLIALTAIGKLTLLPRYFDRIWIPPAVEEELRLDSAFLGTDALQQAIQSGWLQRRIVQQTALVQALQVDLHRGEAEAIALAIENRLPLVLMDESFGRQRARALGLQTVGVLGILLRARKQGDISSLAQAMQALRQEVGFFISESLHRELLCQVGESD